MYKIIQNGRIIDVVQNNFFVKFLPTGHTAFTDKSSAEGIVGSDEFTVYSFLPRKGFKEVSIEEITQDEFSRLCELLNSCEEVFNDNSILNTAKTAAISRLSAACKNKISDGFTIKLSDGAHHNFKLTQEDQLNLLALENQLKFGEAPFIYHETDKPCQVFSREDIVTIIGAFRKHVLYHTTYFNTAKQYIQSLTSTEKINMFTYGMDISSTLTNPLLRQILNGGDHK